MFNFFKKAIQNVVSHISKKVEETPKKDISSQEEKKEKKKEEKEKHQKKERPKKEKQTEREELPSTKEFTEEIKDEQEKAVTTDGLPEKKKTGFFRFLKEKVTTTTISSEEFDELFFELEVVLLENNVAVEVITKIKEDLQRTLVNQSLRRGTVEKVIRDSLKKSIEDLFLVEPIDFLKIMRMKKEKPFVICFFGVNGSGKTTSIAKITHLLQKNHLSVVLAAADTFRAAAIHQLKEWGSRLDVKVIAHDYGSDPAAVAFDAVIYAKAHHIDVVLIDTSGRLHTNKDLMREMEKIVRVAKPDFKIFVGEAITGNDCVEQVKEFHRLVGIDGVILAKADVDERGGAMISTSFVTKKPILFLGVGQELDDLREFHSGEIIQKLGL